LKKGIPPWSLEQERAEEAEELAELAWGGGQVVTAPSWGVCDQGQAVKDLEKV
jgi:hypothetical protein